VLGCDLHVHARPSFDTPVTPEDRVLSLVAAGVDFAVPTEHNVVGDYTSALETLDLTGDLLSVPGVEVTTYSKGFGHFGVFPYPPGTPVPPYKHTTAAAVFRAVRADPNRYFQLNHPRLPKGIGYFANIGFDPKASRTRILNRIDFDGIEVFNGYDTERPERVEQVLHDFWALLDFGWRYAATGSSDSHRIQFHWAGYPRTMVRLDPHATAESDAKPVDPLAVVAAIKKGHAIVTSGPIIEFELEGAHPGEEVTTTDDPLHGHVRVRAAPWVDVTRVEIVVGGRGGATTGVVREFEVPSRPTQLGPEPGTLEEAGQRTIRFDRDFEVAVGPENTWVQVIARGDRRMDDVLPFMPVPPFGFSNPVYVVRRAAAPPPFPLGGARPAGEGPRQTTGSAVGPSAPAPP
jgi:predicted metal-dependent phosphoesterase TrpH